MGLEEDFDTLLPEAENLVTRLSKLVGNFLATSEVISAPERNATKRDATAIRSTD